MSFAQKGIVLKKILKYRKNVIAEHSLTAVRGFQLNYSKECNFQCEHCFAESPGALKDEKTRLSLADVKNLADQVHALGGYEVDLQGGEPLMWPELPEIIKAIDTSRFYLYVTTNGWLMTQKKANELAQLGVDRITVSIDSCDAETHDAFRGVKGAYEKGINALAFAKKAGMTSNINMTITHQNIHSGDVEQMVEFAVEHGYVLIFNLATPSGCWRNKLDHLITEEDAKILQSFGEKYKNTQRDIWAAFEPQFTLLGCPALNLFYVNPAGDILSCPFIHIKIGNILESQLADILKKGWQVKYFRDRSPICLAGEDRSFIKKFLFAKEMSIMNPMPYDTAFSEEDLYAGNDEIY